MVRQQRHLRGQHITQSKNSRWAPCTSTSMTETKSTCMDVRTRSLYAAPAFAMKKSCHRFCISNGTTVKFVLCFQSSVQMLKPIWNTCASPNLHRGSMECWLVCPYSTVASATTTRCSMVTNQPLRKIPETGRAALLTNLSPL